MRPPQKEIIASITLLRHRRVERVPLSGDHHLVYSNLAAKCVNCNRTLEERTPREPFPEGLESRGSDGPTNSGPTNSVASRATMADAHISMSNPAATAKWKQFLEETPPNSSVKISGLVSTGTDVHGAPRVVISPLIRLHCEHDGGLRIFKAAGDAQLWSNRCYCFITYRCRNCLVSSKTIAVVIEWEAGGSTEVMKLGEFPPFSTPISPRIPKLLGDPELDLYRKGVHALDHGLGIGAASYFRRIVESQWKLLVTEIRKAAEQLGIEDLSAYDKALESNQFKSALESLKDAMPEKLLLPGGQNPLTLLHRPLSKQLHGQSDDDCLQQAKDIQLVLEALLDNVATVLKNRAELNAAANRLQTPAKSTNDQLRASGV